MTGQMLEEPADTTDAAEPALPPRPPEDAPPALVLEAALFSAGRPLSVEELREITGIPEAEIKPALQDLYAEYRTRNSAVEVVRSGTKWSLALRPRYADRARKLVPPEIPQHVLRTLALIAYHQPVLQSTIKDMVGYKVYEHVHVLTEAGLVTRKPEGVSFILKTTDSFPEYFGLPNVAPDDIQRALAERVGILRSERAAAGGPLPEPDEALIMAALYALGEEAATKDPQDPA